MDRAGNIKVSSFRKAINTIFKINYYQVVINTNVKVPCKNSNVVLNKFINIWEKYMVLKSMNLLADDRVLSGMTVVAHAAIAFTKYNAQANSFIR